MEEKRKYSNKYTYGNVAYDLQPEIITTGEEKKKSKKRTNNNVKIKLKIMATVVIICIFSVLTLVRAVSIVDLTGSIKTAKAQITESQKINDDLNMKISEIDNVKNIGDTAANKYGMVVPDDKNIVYINVKPLTPIVNDQQSTKAPAFQFIQRLLGLIY